MNNYIDSLVREIYGGAINFHKIHWGAFTKQFKNRKNKRIKNFKEYSNYILKHPNEFNKLTRKRANFYKNFIFGRGINGCGPKPQHHSAGESKSGGESEEEESVDSFPQYEIEENDEYYPEFATDEERLNYIAEEIFLNQYDPEILGNVESQKKFIEIKENLRRLDDEESISTHDTIPSLIDTIISNVSPSINSLNSLNTLPSISSLNTLPSISSLNTLPSQVSTIVDNTVPSIIQISERDVDLSNEIQNVLRTTDLTNKVGKYKYLIDIQEERRKEE